MKKLFILNVVAWVVTLISINSHAATLYVNASAEAGGNGNSWAEAFTDLQDALDAAQDGDEIWVAHGTYTPTSSYGLTGGDRYKHFRLINNVSIIGGFSGTETAVTERSPSYRQTLLSGDIGVEGDNSDNCYHLFYHPLGIGLNETAVLDGFTLAGGNADYAAYPHDSGGAMFNHGASPKVINCLFRGNSALVQGGAIYNAFNSSPELIQCTFVGNSGGAIQNFSSSSPHLTHCILWSNTAENQYEIKNDATSSPKVSHSDIAGSGGSDQWASAFGSDQGGNIDVDPEFINETNGDFHLKIGSPCIDKGGDEALTDTGGNDVDGEPRVADGDGDGIETLDMGSDEFVDSDGDQLSDYEEETIYGTQKDKADSDSDGLNDGWELSLWGAAWDDDPDNDGLVNLLDPDSDNNGKNDSEGDFKGGDDSGCFIGGLSK